MKKSSSSLDISGHFFVFRIYMFTYETRFNEIKTVSLAKLTVKLQNSNNAANICSSLSGLDFILLINWPQTTGLLFRWKTSVDNGDQKISCVKRISVFPSFLLSLTEVCQDKTRTFFGKQVFLPQQPRCNDKMFTSYSIVDHCDSEDLNNLYFICFSILFLIWSSFWECCK